MEAVRTVSFAVAMEQLLNSKKMAAFQTLSGRLWEHTMHVAALSRVLARRFTRVNVDEALFAGLVHDIGVHDIGVFYLLSRAVSFPELSANPRELHQLLADWHDHIGHALLAAMGMPEELVLVVQEHEVDRPVSSISTLADVVFVANRLGDGRRRLAQGCPEQLKPRPEPPASLARAAPLPSRVLPADQRRWIFSSRPLVDVWWMKGREKTRPPQPVTSRLPTIRSTGQSPTLTRLSPPAAPRRSPCGRRGRSPVVHHPCRGV